MASKDISIENMLFDLDTLDLDRSANGLIASEKRIITYNRNEG